MKNKLNIYIITILSLTLLVLIFYWYSYRPSQITKLCMKVSMDRVQELNGDQVDARYFFWKCQKQHGIAE